MTNYIVVLDFFSLFTFTLLWLVTFFFFLILNRFAKKQTQTDAKADWKNQLGFFFMDLASVLSCSRFFFKIIRNVNIWSIVLRFGLKSHWCSPITFALQNIRQHFVCCTEQRSHKAHSVSETFQNASETCWWSQKRFETFLKRSVLYGEMPR